MKSMNTIITLIGAACFALAGCAHTPAQSFERSEYILGAATAKNLATQSIRSVEVPNSKGLTGQSGERAVAAIVRLNAGEATELSDVSASGVGSTANQ